MSSLQAEHEKFNVLFVCTGNLVRSPFAAVLFQSRIDTLLPGAVAVRSAGVSAVSDCAMDRAARLELARLGVAAGDIRSQRINEQLVSEADLVLGADRGHVTHTLTLYPAALNRTFTLTGLSHILGTLTCQLSLNGTEPASANLRRTVQVAARRRILLKRRDDLDIPDPLGAPAAEFNRVLNLIEAAVDRTICGFVTQLSAAQKRE